MSETKLPAILITPPDDPMDVVQVESAAQRFAHLRLVEEEKAHWPQSPVKKWAEEVDLTSYAERTLRPSSFGQGK